MSIKKLGNATESMFAKYMFSLGWWVHILADKANGQPFDVIMAKDETVWFIDIKHSDKPYLLHSRIEENQRNSMMMLKKRNMKNIGFVVYHENEWFFLFYKDINFTEAKTNISSMIKVNETFFEKSP